MDDNGWMPIETAPRDGTRLLLLAAGHPDDYSANVFVGFWGDRLAGYHEDDPANYRWLNWHEGFDEQGYWHFHANVSHWRPLPAPPSA